MHEIYNLESATYSSFLSIFHKSFTLPCFCGSSIQKTHRWPCKCHVKYSLHTTYMVIACMLVHALTLSNLNLPLSSSSNTTRELLSQFSTCSGWRWLEVGGKWKKNMLLLLKQFHDKNRSKPSRCWKLSHFSEMRNDAWMHFEGLKG